MWAERERERVKVRRTWAAEASKENPLAGFQPISGQSCRGKSLDVRIDDKEPAALPVDSDSYRGVSGDINVSDQRALQEVGAIGDFGEADLGDPSIEEGRYEKPAAWMVPFGAFP